MDYYVWGELTRVVNNRPYNNKYALKTAIKDAMISLDNTVVSPACASFRRRLEAVVETDGGYF